MKIDVIRKKKPTSSLAQIKDLEEESLKAHAACRGKIETIGKVRIKCIKDLAIYYTPGVAFVSNAIRSNKDLSYAYSGRGNRIAILSDGSRILGLGDIGPEAGIPVMEGKALLFKKFGNVDAVHLLVNVHTADEIIAVAKAIEPSFGGINIEDIAAPKCFDILDKLQKELNIPVFHDDRQGTAIVVYAALKNALKLTDKNISDVKIVINGIGAAGVGIAQLLLAAGAKNITMCDKRGILYKGRPDNMNGVKNSLAEYTNPTQLKGALEDAAKGAAVLIGTSTKGLFNEGIIRSMQQKPIVFALANPDPEIEYDNAIASGAEIVATGQSDVPNQVNNLLAFPAVFRGMLEVNASKVNTSMLIAAGDALAASVQNSKLHKDHIIPNFVDDNMDTVTSNIAAAVGKAAIDSGVAKVKIDQDEIRKRVLDELKRYSKMEKAIGKV